MCDKKYFVNLTNFEIFKMFTDNISTSRNHFKSNCYDRFVIYGRYFGLLKGDGCKKNYINFRYHICSMFLKINEPTFNICRLLHNNHEKIQAKIRQNMADTVHYFLEIDDKEVDLKRFNDSERVLIYYFMFKFQHHFKEKEKLLKKLEEEQERINLTALCEGLIHEELHNKTF